MTATLEKTVNLMIIEDYKLTRMGLKSSLEEFEGISVIGEAEDAEKVIKDESYAAIAAINREMNSKKWTFRAIAFQNVYAYLLCTVIYQFGRVFVEGQAFNVWTAVAAVIVALAIYLVIRPAAKPMDLNAKEVSFAQN